MKAVTVRQIQELERVAIEGVGIPSLALMENAGRAVALEVLKKFQKHRPRSVCIFCGIGNNGGDGFVAARHLLNAGIKVKVFLIGSESDLKADPAVFYRALKKLKLPVKTINRINSADLKDIAGAPVIIDAIFGVGLNRAIGEPHKSIIQALNAQKKIVIAVDIPSGLDGTTGKVLGICVKASLTVTFTFLKKGFLKGDGPRYAGRVVVADIGIPQKLLKTS